MILIFIFILIYEIKFFEEQFIALTKTILSGLLKVILGQKFIQMVRKWQIQTKWSSQRPVDNVMAI